MRRWGDSEPIFFMNAEADFGLALQQSAYALDSTTIDLCLSLFPRARNAG